MEQIKDVPDLVKLNWPTPGKLKSVLCGKDVRLNLVEFCNRIYPKHPDVYKCRTQKCDGYVTLICQKNGLNICFDIIGLLCVNTVCFKKCVPYFKS